MTASLGRILDEVVIGLFARTTRPLQDRPTHLGRLLVVETPDQAAQVLDTPSLFAKNFAFVSAFGPSRFNLNGPEWEALRPRSQRAYAQAGRPAMQPRIAAIFDEELAAAPATAAGVETALARAALRVFFLAHELEPDVGPFVAFFTAFRPLVTELQAMSWQEVAPARREDILARATQAQADFAKACADQPAIMATISRLAAMDPALPVATILTDFMTNMFAGFETTTAALGWMIDCLGRNADLQTALRDQAQTGQGPLLSSFRDECLRVFPPTPMVVREATAPTTLGPHDLDTGDLVLLSLVGLHRDPASWTDPLAFHAARPEFAPGAAPNPAFRPFLTGPRACGGRRIAEMELTECLRLLLLHFRFESPAEDPAFHYSLTFRPRLTTAHLVARR